MMQQQKSNSHWDNLGPDLVELILSRLPIPSILRAASVCKQWNSIVHHSTSFRALLLPLHASSSLSSSTTEHHHPPPCWFFFACSFINYNSLVFGFDPLSNCWIRFPHTAATLPGPFAASDGYLFSTGTGKFLFKRTLGENWRQASPPRAAVVRCRPLIGAYNDKPDSCKPASRFIVAGGTSVDNSLAVEIYNPNDDTWETCSPLPEIFRLGNAVRALCSAVHGGKFYVLGICWNFVSSFDLKDRCWSPVRTLKLPGAQFTHLVSIRDRLVLVGFCGSNNGLEVELIVWRVDEETYEFSEIGIMPQELVSIFIGSGCNPMHRFVKCAGWGNEVYVMNALNGQACVCEIDIVADPGEEGECKWRMVPRLPGLPVEEFHNFSSFCSTVSLQDILLPQEESLLS